MISYSDALRKILDHTPVMEAEENRVPDSLGQVLANDVYSDLDLPRFDVAMPDGYAVRSADILGADRNNPVNLKIIETVRAGFVPEQGVAPGTAIRIMTGSVVPEGADCVVRFEDTDEPGNKNGPNRKNPAKVDVYTAVEPGTNIRRAGTSIKKGSLLLSKGHVIGPAQISVLTLTGKTHINVIRRPVVAVIATGDELVPAGTALPPGKSYDCNTPAMASFVASCGGIPRILGIAADKESSIEAMITEGSSFDAVITSGGVSMGDYDLVRLVLGRLGYVVFSRIKMGPGASVAFGYINKPLRNGKHRQVPVFALSGPPSGCLINLETLVRSALLKMRGLTAIHHTVVQARAADRVPVPKPKAFVRWTKLERGKTRFNVTLNGTDRTGPLVEMAEADSLTIIPEDTTVNKGDRIEVLPLSWRTDSSDR